MRGSVFRHIGRSPGETRSKKRSVLDTVSLPNHPPEISGKLRGTRHDLKRPLFATVKAAQYPVEGVVSYALCGFQFLNPESCQLPSAIRSKKLIYFGGFGPPAISLESWGGCPAQSSIVWNATFRTLIAASCSDFRASNQPPSLSRDSPPRISHLPDEVSSRKMTHFGN